MRVLIADKLPEMARASLESVGCQVDFEPALKGDTLVSALSSSAYDVLVVRSTRVELAMLQACESLSLIIRAGAGTNTIDVNAAAARGIYVANCPGKNADAVAELTLGLILSADRQIPNNVRDLRAGVWKKKHYGKSAGIYGRTLGLIGFGNIGQAVASRARAFGLDLVVWSRSMDAGRAAAQGVTLASDPEDVARQADMVSVHLALSEETRGIIDQKVIDALKPGAIFINTSRGELVDQDALLSAMDEKQIRCGLDVYHNEPGAGDETFDNPALSHELLFGTHHIGASTDQAQEAVAMHAVAIVKEFKATGRVPNCVNLRTQSAATHVIVVRHLDRVGVLAGVFATLRNASINVQETENIVFDGAEAAVARIRIQSEPEPWVLTAIENIEHVLASSLLEVSG